MFRVDRGQYLFAICLILKGLFSMYKKGEIMKERWWGLLPCHTTGSVSNLTGNEKRSSYVQSNFCEADV